MKGLFGLAFLESGEVSDSFVEDFMSVQPQDEKCVRFADYLTKYYVADESLFPPIVWAESQSQTKRNNNGPESFHAHFNEQLYKSHPHIYLFVDTIIKLQTTSYIKSYCSAVSTRQRKQ